MQFIRLLQPGVSSARIIFAGGYFSTGYLKWELPQHMPPKTGDTSAPITSDGRSSAHVTQMGLFQHMSPDRSYFAPGHLRSELPQQKPPQIGVISLQVVPRSTEYDRRACLPTRGRLRRREETLKHPLSALTGRRGLTGSARDRQNRGKPPKKIHLEINRRQIGFQHTLISLGPRSSSLPSHSFHNVIFQTRPVPGMFYKLADSVTAIVSEDNGVG